MGINQVSLTKPIYNQGKKTPACYSAIVTDSSIFLDNYLSKQVAWNSPHGGVTINSISNNISLINTRRTYGDWALKIREENPQKKENYKTHDQ